VAELVLAGGRVLDASGERVADVVIGADGRVVAVGAGLAAPGGGAASGWEFGGRVEVLDVSGCVVTPGLVDLFCGVGEPGAEELETLASASRAAVEGGYTALVVRPDANHRLATGAEVREVLALGAATACCEVAVAASLTTGPGEGRLAPLAELTALGVRLFGDPGQGVEDAAVLRRALQYAGDLGVTVAQPAVNPALAGPGCIHEGAWSARLGLAGVPAEAEESGVMQLVALARALGVAVHVRQVTTAASLAMLGAARRGGLRVSADVSPAHALLTDAALAGVFPPLAGWAGSHPARSWEGEPDPDRAYDPLVRFDPPLRPEDDRAAVHGALHAGDVDVLVSAHTPVSPMGKELPVDSAEPGAIGLDATLGLALGPLGLALPQALSLLSWRPAALAGLSGQGGLVEPGRVANLAVIEPETTWIYDPTRTQSRSRNTPWTGLRLQGRVRHTVSAGEVVVRDGQVVDQ
jgi:dihydroorotase